MRGLLLAVLLSLPASAQELGAWNSACFGGLNDAVTPAALTDCESPDLLNTESNLDATALLKRKGFAKTADLTVATSPVTGSHSFIDSSGNRLDIVCQDRNCAKSTNGNAFAAFLTTATAGVTRWSFVDVGGVLYGANNKFDPIMKYDGTTRTSAWGMPLGSILALTQDRLAVGDITTLPNRVHYSSAGAYEQFTVGVNPEDSFFDDIGADGDRVRGIKCVQGNCFIFKTASITLCEMADQYSTQCSVISPNIGTTDPASITAAGPDLYFRAQDKNYWRIGKDGLEQISKKIPALVKSQSGGLGGGENTNTQTTKADWDAGVQLPLLSWNTGSINGSIFQASITLVDTSGADFGAFTSSVSVSTLAVGGSITLQISSPSFANGGFESGTLDNWTNASAWAIDSAGPCYGTYSAKIGCANISTTLTVKVENSGGTLISSAVYSGALTCSEKTLPGGVGQTIRIVATENTSGNSLTSQYFLGGDNATFKITQTGAAAPCSAPNISTRFDLVESTGFVSGGNYVSRSFDTLFSTPTGGLFTVDMSSSVDGAVTFQLQDSADDSSYGSLSAITPGDRITNIRRYWRYKPTFSNTVSTKTAIVNSVSLVAATTGQYRTQCIQPNSSISAWGTLSCAQTITGSSSIVFYATSALTCAALPTTHPVNAAGAVQSGWTAQTNNATVTVATNTAVYIGWRSLLGSATDQAQVDACVLAWNEGTPAQPSWATYDSIKNAIYWTATINNASATNRLLKYDLNLGQWYPFDIAAQAPRVINNALYFGGAAAGTWNKYGDVDADAGASINAYWKSKDIGSDKPFQEKSFKSLSILSRNQVTGNMTGTWTLSNSQTGSYTISLSTASGINYARSNYLLPYASAQQFLNVKISNNSATPFEVLGVGVTWSVLPWRVSGP